MDLALQLADVAGPGVGLEEAAGGRGDDRLGPLRGRVLPQERAHETPEVVAAHPQVIEALREVGIDATDHMPRPLDTDLLAWADVAVSTCSEEACPVTPGVRRLTWHLADPKNMPLADVRVIRDEIQRLVGGLVDDLHAAADANPA
jgi:hypothetical protein